MGQLRASGVTAHLNIVGDGTERLSLEDLVRRSGLESQITFTGGLERALVAHQLKQSDVFVSLSRSDGLSTSLVEALACGLFPVVSDIPSNRQVVEHGRNGLLVDGDNPDDIAAALVMAASNRDLREHANQTQSGARPGAIRYSAQYASVSGDGRDVASEPRPGGTLRAHEHNRTSMTSTAHANRTINILYIVQHFTTPSSAGSARAFENARRLVQRGHRVTMLCGRLDRNAESDLAEAKSVGIDLRMAPILYTQRMSYTRRLIAFRRYMVWAMRTGRQLSRPDVVLASSTPLTVGEIGRKVASHHKVPFVFEVRDLWPEVPITLGALKSPLLRWVARRMAARVYAAADAVVALSPDMARVVETWGVDSLEDKCHPELERYPALRLARSSRRKRGRAKSTRMAEQVCLYSSRCDGTSQWHRLPSRRGADTRPSRRVANSHRAGRGWQRESAPGEAHRTRADPIRGHSTPPCPSDRCLLCSPHQISDS